MHPSTIQNLPPKNPNPRFSNPPIISALTSLFHSPPDLSQILAQTFVSGLHCTSTGISSNTFSLSHIHLSKQISTSLSAVGCSLCWVSLKMGSWCTTKLQARGFLRGFVRSELDDSHIFSLRGQRLRSARELFDEMPEKHLVSRN